MRKLSPKDQVRYNKLRKRLEAQYGWDSPPLELILHIPRGTSVKVIGKICEELMESRNLVLKFFAK